MKTRYYWCVNCGNSEDLGRERARGVKCTACGYDEITPLEEEEWEEELQKRNIVLQKDTDESF